ncbi:hypothetical protein O181_025591 [Austropuccinia psidii MF-1]|uniref:diphosphoinositol-polyphosphate diphosphatase n=1 Tax=Austropuccinia psidii MF-1 TaxID=1389203 RepID=A0A9Q3GZP8_9BASI|nr:hypothetical protein [Austropuccinia psidii MF-1]
MISKISSSPSPSISFSLSLSNRNHQGNHTGPHTGTRTGNQGNQAKHQGNQGNHQGKHQGNQIGQASTSNLSSNHSASTASSYDSSSSASSSSSDSSYESSHSLSLPPPALCSFHCKLTASHKSSSSFHPSISSHSISLNPPHNFATIAPNLYRSSFPRLENLEFLNRLGLKTILTLVQEEYPQDLKNHYTSNGIKLIQFAIPGNKEPFVHIPEDKIRLALKQVLDVRNHPMLIHCNKGKHRTGCLVGCLRKLQLWSSTAIFDEYRRFAFPKSRNMDQQFIELFDHSAVCQEIDSQNAPNCKRMSITQPFKSNHVEKYSQNQVYAFYSSSSFEFIYICMAIMLFLEKK